MTTIQFVQKRIFDVSLAFLGIIVLLVPMVIVAAMIRLTSSGPILYLQIRVGKHGIPFRILKFRTMTVGADKQGSITTTKDQRITRIGRWLRRLKLDEFPQLFNVLVGKMSFVGPRPDVPGYADLLEGDERKVLELIPGITGPASIVFRDEEVILANVDDPIQFNDHVIFTEKVRLNLEYLHRWSLMRDIGFILITVFPVFNHWFKLVDNNIPDVLFKQNE